MTHYSTILFTSQTSVPLIDRLQGLGPVFYAPGGDTGPTTIDDISTNDNDATAVGSPTFGEPGIDNNTTAIKLDTTYDQALAAITATPTLILKMDETSGTTIEDTSGNNRDGTISGSYTLGQPAPERIGSGNSIDFSGGAIDLPYTLYGSTDDFTINLWAKCDNTAATDRLFGLNFQAPLVALKLNGNFADPFTVMPNTATAIYLDSTGRTIESTITVTEWHMYTMTVSYNDKMKLYIDGDLKGQVSIDSVTQQAGDSQNNRVGAARNGTVPHNGLIDDFRIFDGVLTEDEIKGLYLGGYIDFSNNADLIAAISDEMTLNFGFKPTDAYNSGTATETIIDMHDGTDGLLITYDSGDLIVKIDSDTDSYTVDIASEQALWDFAYNDGLTSTGVLTYTLDSTKIDSDLPDFVVPITVTHAAFFADIDSDAKRKKVLFKDYSGTSLYAEIQADYDIPNKKITYFVSIPTATAASDPTITLNFDGSGADQDTYTDDTNSTAGEAVYDSGYAYVFHLATDPDTAIQDSTGNGYAGIDNATINVSNVDDGLIGKAYRFNGTDEYFKVPTTSIFTGADEMTIELLLKSDSVRNSRPFEWGDEDPGVSIRTNSGGTFSCELLHGASGAFTANGSATLTDWNHVVLTAKEGGSAYLYINGVQVGTASGIGSFRGYTGGYDNIIGCGRSLNATQFFDGLIDNVTVHGTQRSGDWVKARSAALLGTLISEPTGTVKIYKDAVLVDTLTGFPSTISLPTDGYAKANATYGHIAIYDSELEQSDITLINGSIVPP